MLRLITSLFVGPSDWLCRPRPEIHWPQGWRIWTSDSGSIYEAQKRRIWKLYCPWTGHQDCQDSTKLHWKKSNIKPIINERFIWESQRQQGEWGALKEMARESTVDPVRVSSVLDAGLHRKNISEWKLVWG